MKKFFILWVLILSLLFAFSCSSDEEKEELDQGDADKTDTASTSGDQDKTDTADSANDSGDSADSDRTDSSDSDSSPDTDASDTEADSTDSADNSDNPLPDDGSDSTDDSATDNDTETAPDDDGHFQECSDPSCTDSGNGLIWSGKTTATYSWSDSKNYCENQGNGWRLPTIDELRTLVLNCAETATNGACNVKEGCLNDSSDCYSATYCVSKNCPTRNDGSYSRLGDTGYLWSSSEMEGNANRAWYINFKFAAIGSSDKSRSDLAYTRCVKNQ